jgi:hypothetical protein
MMCAYSRFRVYQDVAVASGKSAPGRLAPCQHPPGLSLAPVPADRRDALNEVRRGINRALPPEYKEGIQFGMISWFVPLL